MNLPFLSLLLLLGTSIVAAGGTINHRKLITASSGTRITGRYIVTLNDGVSDVLAKAKELLANSGAVVDFEYNTVFKGFAVGGLVAKFLTLVLDDDMVVSVEEDQEILEDQSFKFNQASPADWALDRIDQTSLPLDGNYRYSFTGKGVYVFIIDSGINLDHSEFTGRVQCGYIAVPNEDCYDVRGHGSHVAGIAAGTTYGVAKGANIVAVKVLASDGTGQASAVIAGVEYVAQQKNANKSVPMVANMSLGASKSTSINNAVYALVATGVVLMSSAGNDNFDACNKSPASVETAITVGAVGKDDYRASYSNFGSCVDLFAPGTGITSAWYGSSTASKTLSGTSMSTPVVTGVAALYLERDPSMTPLQVKQAMVADGALGVVQSTQGSPNILISTVKLSGNSPTATVSSPVASPVRAPTPVSKPVTAPTSVSAQVPKPTPVSAPTPRASPVSSPLSSTASFEYRYEYMESFNSFRVVYGTPVCSNSSDFRLWLVSFTAAHMLLKMARLEIIWNEGFHVSRTMPAILYGMVEETSFAHFCDRLDAALLRLHVEHERKRMRASACLYGMIFCFIAQAVAIHIEKSIPDTHASDWVLACFFVYLMMIAVMMMFYHSDLEERQAVAKIRALCEEMSNTLHPQVSFQVAMVPMSVEFRNRRNCGECMSPNFTVDHISVNVSGMIRSSALTTEASHTGSTSESTKPSDMSDGNTAATNDYQLMAQEIV